MLKQNYKKFQDLFEVKLNEIQKNLLKTKTSQIITVEVMYAAKEALV